jgi:subtilisin family serine protease
VNAARRTLTLVATATCLVAAPAAARAEDASPDAAALERAGVVDIVVKHRGGLGRDARADLRADAGVRLETTLPLPGTEVVRAAPGRLTEALDALDADPDVLYAEPDAPVHATADARFGEQWALRNTGQRILGQTGTADADIDAPEAWSVGATGAGVTVAVVDTGIALTHPDLAPRVATNPGESGGGRETNRVDDDLDGYVDDWRGWDFVADDNVPADENGHGTHVSGTIVAAQDATGISGVAPDARVLPLRVLDSTGSGSSSDVAAAFDLAGRLGIPVVNASLGSTGLSSTQRAAINAHPNTLYVVAAGNDGRDDDTTPTYPCAMPAPNIVCVGATDNRDARAGFSNVGAQSVDLLAPGVGVLSTYGAGYAYLNGTSMATPHVAGVLALIRQAAPTLNAAQLKQDVLDTADRRPALAGLAVTGARLNALAAIQTARTITGLPALVPYDPIPPIATPTPTPTPAPAAPAPVTGEPSPRPVPAPVRRPVRPAPPSLTRLGAAPATAIVCRAGAPGCRPRAAVVRFAASRAAAVTAQVQRRSCAGARCAYRTAATLAMDAAAGANRLAIGARGATARLAPGAYRVRLVATAGARESAPVASAIAVRRR